MTIERSAALAGKIGLVWGPWIKGGRGPEVLLSLLPRNKLSIIGEEGLYVKEVWAALSWRMRVSSSRQRARAAGSVPARSIKAR